MAALAALSLLFARGAIRLDTNWVSQLSRTSTVQVLVPNETLREAQMDSAQALLRQAVPDAKIDQLSRDESLNLIQPWLGATRLPDDLPVPGVITIRTDTRLPIESLTRQFEDAGLRVSLDDHSRFSDRLEQTVQRLVLLGIGLVLLTFIAAIAVSIFATRSGLAAQRDIIHVLVQAGASDHFIARLFVGRAARQGAIGGLIGTVGALVLWLYVSFGPGRNTLGWSSLGNVVSDILWLAALIIAFALICALAAGWAARRQLADERRRA
jgi:cell division transport system permease protein